MQQNSIRMPQMAGQVNRMQASHGQNGSSGSTAASQRAIGSMSRSTSTRRSFMPKPSTQTLSCQVLGNGLPGFRTSFNSAGKGGGAFRPISENFNMNPANGTFSLSVPLRISPTRGGFGPDCQLTYDSGLGNGPFGFGWDLSLPSVSLKTAHGIPRYIHEDEIVLSGASIVHKLNKQGAVEKTTIRQGSDEFEVTLYRPRVDDRSMRIEKWAKKGGIADIHWKTITSENVTSVYGLEDDSRIFDNSRGHKRVFTWLLCRAYDSHGNAIEYSYKQEDREGLARSDGTLPVWEYHRDEEANKSQKYLKRIKYGNKTPNRDLVTWEAIRWPQDWMFEIVLDYGEHDTESPSSMETKKWKLRQDSFSQCNSGFEIRTHRLCQRFLMFHHFPEYTRLDEILVSSTTFSYDESAQRTILETLTINGHTVKNGSDRDDIIHYITESLPPLSFNYTKPTGVDQMETLPINIANIAGVPGIGTSSSEWLDLDGEGFPGLLSKLQGGSLLYQSSVVPEDDDGEAAFLSGRILPTQPNIDIHSGSFEDLERTGNVNFVSSDLMGRRVGFYERDDSDSWSEFTEFPQTPTNESGIDATVSIDLTGDGLSDMMFENGDNQCLAWYQSLGKIGRSGHRQASITCQGRIPSLRSTATVQTHVADMTGDGLSDLVEVTQRKITYWANHGHGQFGFPIEMGNPPNLGDGGEYDPERVKLIDVDGSGTTDLIYILPEGGARLFYNLAGNSWSDAVIISKIPAFVNPSQVFVLDILGRGTACICWVDAANLATPNELHYLELMGSAKPHLLREYSNSIGAHTTVKYAPSTKFYRKDLYNGRRWTTKLPFPTQCVAKIQVTDFITGSTKVSEYVYHNGYYDPVEKQFAGFEMVEEWQHETVRLGESRRYNAPTLHKRSWFNVGKSLEVDESQYFNPPRVSSCLQGQSGFDTKDALYALRGHNIRTEIYGHDGTSKSDLPYETLELSYDLKVVQAKGCNKHAVVQCTPRASFTSAYGRNMDDPRDVHEIVLKSNDFGDIEESLRVVYPRKKAPATETQYPDVEKNQCAGNLSLLKALYTDFTDSFEGYRKPVGWKSQDYELLGFSFTGVLDVDEVRHPNQTSPMNDKSVSHVLRSESRSIFTNSELTSPLAEGGLELFSVLDQSYSLAFTADLVARMKQGLEASGFTRPIEEILKEGGYIKLPNQEAWWAPSATTRFSKSSVPAEELQAARLSFFTPTIFRDPFENESRVDLDKNYLMAERTQDAIGNTTTFNNDYQHLMPFRVTDTNSNVQEATIDTLGHIIATRVLELDQADTFDPRKFSKGSSSPNAVTIDTLLTDATGEVARSLLLDYDVRFIHDLHRYSCFEKLGSNDSEEQLRTSPSGAQISSPAVVVKLSRNLSSNRSSSPMISIDITYLDGMGSPLQNIHLADSEDQSKWLASGGSATTISGLRIRSFDSYFTSTPNFIPLHRVNTRHTTNFYDALGHSIGTLQPDSTWSKVVTTPWMSTSYSADNTVLCSQPQDDPDIGAYFSRLEASDYLPTWYEIHRQGSSNERQAAMKSEVYNNSPSVTHLGSCGLAIRSVQEAGSKTRSRTLLYDVSGNKVRDYDSFNRLIEKAVYDKLNRCIFVTRMDKGEDWVIPNVVGSSFVSWNSRKLLFYRKYDSLGRETHEILVRQGDAPKLVQKTTYGENSPLLPSANLQGQVWQIKDQSGVHMNCRYDVRGHCIEKTFQPAQEYKAILDWGVDVPLEARSFSNKVVFDNYGHKVAEEDPEGNRTRRKYSRLGHIESVDYQQAGSESWKPYLLKATFDADRLPLVKTYANGVTTELDYDSKSRHLTSQRSFKLSRGEKVFLEDLSYTYDCIGHKVHVVDASEQSKHFRNCQIKPEWDYTYDAFGQLISATGRSQLPSSAGKGAQLKPYSAMTGSKAVTGVGDGNSLYEYRESYTYDVEGNIQSMTHQAHRDASITGWTRQYFYEEASLLEDTVKGNRLSRTVVGSKEEKYCYEGEAGSAGCITGLPQYSQLSWNLENLLASSSTQFCNIGTPETTYYVYDYTGKRVRKVTESFEPSDSSPRKMRDTLYLVGVELQLRLSGDGTKGKFLKKISSATGGELLALIETSGKEEGVPLVRFQIGRNMELDDSGQLISYEEYSPFGSVVYTAQHRDIEARRTYRFARYEHDQETGLYHCGARYYCPWLGRWMSPDPLGDVDGPNLYCYALNDTVNLEDPEGTSVLSGVNYPISIYGPSYNKKVLAKIEARLARARSQPPSRNSIKARVASQNLDSRIATERITLIKSTLEKANALTQEQTDMYVHKVNLDSMKKSTSRAIGLKKTFTQDGQHYDMLSQTFQRRVEGASTVELPSVGRERIMNKSHLTDLKVCHESAMGTVNNPHAPLVMQNEALRSSHIGHMNYRFKQFGHELRPQLKYHNIDNFTSTITINHDFRYMSNLITKRENAVGPINAAERKGYNDARRVLNTMNRSNGSKSLPRLRNIQ